MNLNGNKKVFEASLLWFIARNLPPRCSFVNVTTEIIKVLTGINKLMTITCYNSLLCSENYFRKKTTRPAMIEKTR